MKPKFPLLALFCLCCMAARPVRAVQVPTLWLHAGAVRLKFTDGQLHYLQENGKELFRRLYFAVRDSNWDTIAPVFTRCTVHKTRSSFHITLAAECRRDPADCTWQEVITGSAEGRITCRVTCKIVHGFASNRIGLCLIYGAGSLAGTPFTVTHPDGTHTRSHFPRLVDSELAAQKFTTLTYALPGGDRVTAREEGAEISMEDQRNYGDSSYKAYSTLPFSYPGLTAGEQAQETITLQAPSGSVPKPLPSAAQNVLTVGAQVPGVFLPRIVTGLPVHTPTADFGTLNFHRKRYQNAAELQWGYCPAIHLKDSDNFRDNALTALYQGETAHQFAPHARLTLKPVGFWAPYPLAQEDPRDKTAFGAAWCTAAIKYMALGGIAEADFAFPPGAATSLQRALAAQSGQPLWEVQTAPAVPQTLEAFGVGEGSPHWIWIVNLTGHAVKAELAVTRSYGRLQIGSRTARLVHPLTAHQGRIPLTLPPYGVCELAAAG